VLEAGGVARPDLDDWIAGVGGAPSLPEGESRPAPGPQSADDALVSGSWPAGTVEPLDEGGDLLRRAQAVDRLSAAMSGWVDARARELAAEGKLVGLVGGDHSTPLGLLREVASRHPGLGVLHLDAHADLRPAFEGFRYSHASIFWNVRRELPGVARLIQVGVRDFSGGEAALIAGSGGGIRPWFDGDLRRRLQDGEPWTSLAREIVADLPGEVYVSIDIDGLDPSLCPHTGTPVPGGLSFPEAVSLLRHVAESGRRIVGFDLVEVAPGPDGDEWDGNVGARLLYKLVGFALRSQEGTGAV